MKDIVSPSHDQDAQRIREVLATYESAEDLISVGAYTRGTQPHIDRAVESVPRVNQFLRQSLSEKISFDAVQQGMKKIFEIKKSKDTRK